MRSIPGKLVSIGFLMLGLSNSSLAQFASTDHCVAWKTKKTMFLVSDEEPVGKNCKITVSAKKDSTGTQILMSIPIKAFDSGEPDRDSEVFLILMGKESPDLKFVSNRLGNNSLEQMKAGKLMSVPGQLKIGKKSFPISFQSKGKMQGSKVFFIGKAKTTFSKLGMEPPSVAAGLVASVDDYLELHLHLDGSKISGL